MAEKLVGLQNVAANLLEKMHAFNQDTTIQGIIFQGTHASFNAALEKHFPAHPAQLDMISHDQRLQSSLKKNAAYIVSQLEPWYSMMLDIALFSRQATQFLKEAAEIAPVVSVSAIVIALWQYDFWCSKCVLIDSENVFVLILLSLRFAFNNSIHF